VRICGYCGEENNGELSSCTRCGTELRELAKTNSTYVCQFPGLEAVVEESCAVLEGFRRPDWKNIERYINDTFNEELKPTAWDEASIAWVKVLQKDLGGDYHLSISGRSVVLSELEPESRHQLAETAEATNDSLRWMLPGLAPSEGFRGLTVILIFSEQDDYYTYAAYFYPEGTHSFTWGLCLHGFLPHVAINLSLGRGLPYVVLTHELVHKYVAHLKLPFWIDEGLAGMIERRVHPSPAREFDNVASEWSYWNHETVQHFWAGASFGTLSYWLAEMLLDRLARNRQAFLEFLRLARPEDAGNSAAQKCFGVGLGELAYEFLGPGSWSPDPTTIAKLQAGTGEGSEENPDAANPDLKTADTNAESAETPKNPENPE